MGDNNALLVQVLAGLVAIFMLVAVYFNLRTWKVFHVLMCIALFASCVTFVVFASFVLKTHHKWRSKFNELTADVSSRETKRQELMTGKSVVAKATSDTTETEKAAAAVIAANEENENGLRKALAAVARERTTRGRVWRNSLVATSTANSVVVEMLLDALPTPVPVEGAAPAPAAPVPAAPPAAAPPAAVAPPVAGVPPAAGAPPVAPAPAAPPAASASGAFAYGFEGNEDGKKLIVQLFQERQIPTLSNFPPHRAPSMYIGEYLVDSVKVADVPATAADAKAKVKLTLDLKPRLPVDEQRTKVLADKESTFVLYEVMPYDSRESFAALTFAELEALFPTALEGQDALPTTVNRDSPAYKDVRRQFLYDGKTRAQVETIFNDRLNVVKDDPGSAARAEQIKKERDADLAWFDRQPADRKWIRVKFTKLYSREVDNKSKAAGPAQGAQPISKNPSYSVIRATDVGQLFDENGAAIAAHLWLNPAAADTKAAVLQEGKVKPGTILTLEPTVAANLIDQGYCEKDSTDPNDEKNLPAAAAPAEEKPATEKAAAPASDPAAPASGTDPKPSDEKPAEKPDASSPAPEPSAEPAPLSPARRSASYEVYTRDRRDYRAIYHQILADLAELDTEMVKIKDDTTRVVAATTSLKAQVALRTEEKGKLEQDKQGYEQEVKEIAAYLEQLKAKRDQVVAQARAVADANQRMAAELATLQKKMADEINARTRALSAAPPTPVPAK